MALDSVDEHCAGTIQQGTVEKLGGWERPVRGREGGCRRPAPQRPFLSRGFRHPETDETGGAPRKAPRRRRRAAAIPSDDRRAARPASLSEHKASILCFLPVESAIRNPEDPNPRKRTASRWQALCRCALAVVGSIGRRPAVGTKPTAGRPRRRTTAPSRGGAGRSTAILAATPAPLSARPAGRPRSVAAPDLSQWPARRQPDVAVPAADAAAAAAAAAAARPFRGPKGGALAAKT